MRHLIHHQKECLAKLKGEFLGAAYACLSWRGSVIFPLSFVTGTRNSNIEEQNLGPTNYSAVQNTVRKAHCKEKKKKKGCLLLLSDLAITVTCCNHKKVQMKVRNFKPAMFLLMRKKKYTDSRMLLLPSFLSPSHKRGSQRRITFKVPVEKS